MEAIVLLSVLALATLLRASLRAPLNSAFSRRTDEKERLEPERENETADSPLIRLARPSTGNR